MKKPRVLYHEDKEWVLKSYADKLAIAAIAPVGSYIESIETITIGNYRISKYSGGYWISTDGGEGMQTTEALEKCIDEFYKREF